MDASESPAELLQVHQELGEVIPSQAPDHADHADHPVDADHPVHADQPVDADQPVHADQPAHATAKDLDSNNNIASPSSPVIMAQDDAAENMEVSTPTTSSTPESSSPLPSTTPLSDTTTTTTTTADAASTSFYSNLDFDLEALPTTASTTPPLRPSQIPIAIQTSAPALSPSPSTALDRVNSASSSMATTPISPTSNADGFGSTPRFGSRHIRNSASTVHRRINMLESGQNENNSSAHTRNDSLDSMPDSAEVSEADLEKLLEEEEQAALSRASSRIPKPTITTTTNTPAPRATVTHKTSMPLRLPSTIKNSNGFGMTKGDDVPPSPATFTPSGDAQADLRKLETEVNRLKEIKVKAENEATSQRVLIVSLKTEAQLVRNVLKRREKELEDMKDVSGLYEGQLSELRSKLGDAEQKLRRGHDDLEAQVRNLERLRDEGVERIQTLDKEIKKYRDDLEAERSKSAGFEYQVQEMQTKLEELGAAALVPREDPAKVQELNLQINDLEDTRSTQAALIKELEDKISSAEAQAVESRGKAQMEYETLSDGYKTLRNRRSEEIKVLVAQLEQHKIQEQIIEKLQADIEQLQSSLTAVAESHSTENARLSQVNTELNEALAAKDQEVLVARQNMTEFQDSHKSLVESLQGTLTTINEEADAARKSRDEAVKALGSLREELEALRHSLPINSKHMSLSQWSAEQQQSQQEQLKAISELQQKLDGQVEGVKGEQERAGVLEANTKRKSMLLTRAMEHHLQLSSAIANKTFGENAKGVSMSEEEEYYKSTSPNGTVSVRTMLKFLASLQGRPATLTHQREGTEATLGGDVDLDYENQLRVYLLNLNDETLMEPWAKEKQLEGDIQQLEKRIQAILAEDRENGVATEGGLLYQQEVLDSKEKELALKETTLRQKEEALEAREEELVNEEIELQKKVDALPITPPTSGPITPFGSPSNDILMPSLMSLNKDGEKDSEIAQQAKLIKSLTDKIAELEKRSPPSPSDDQPLPSPPIIGTPRSSTALSRIGSQTLTRSSLLGSGPDTPPPTIALPPIPISSDFGDVLSPRSSSPGKPTLPHTVSSDSLPNNKAAVDAAVAAAVAKYEEAQKELEAKLAKMESDLKSSKSKNKELEAEMASSAASSPAASPSSSKAQDGDMQKLRQENAELNQVLDDIRKSLDQAQASKSQLEVQVQKEKTAKDEAIRMQDHLQTQLEMLKQKKKGFMCF
ncbi:hypothetical protein BGX31_008775 [Mortierella sp. GBA43]|nr:hypothetical protein BGX31_008775 [Mortierella sp. GBA43]